MQNNREFDRLESAFDQPTDMEIFHDLPNAHHDIVFDKLKDSDSDDPFDGMGDCIDSIFHSLPGVLVCSQCHHALHDDGTCPRK